MTLAPVDAFTWVGPREVAALDEHLQNQGKIQPLGLPSFLPHEAHRFPRH